jgi:hypothetical protein
MQIKRDIFESVGCTDIFVAAQLELALLVAAERWDQASPHAPYFDSLPHPAVNDTAVLAAHEGLMDAGDLRAYADYQRDFGVMLQSLQRLWAKAAVKGSDGSNAQEGVPALPVLHWAWRTVLSRQNPLPLYGAPNVSRKERRDFSTLHFVQWVSLRQGTKEGMLLPTLTPFFDLVDHGPVPNVRIDVVMRSASATEPEPTPDPEAKPRFSLNGEKKTKANQPAWDPLFRKFVGGQNNGIMKTLSKAATSCLETLNLASSNDATVAHLELQLIDDVEPGTPLVYRYAKADNTAFGLYRFGFYTVTY